METHKFRDLTPNQIKAAKHFESKYGVSVSQCGKWLDWFFALERGEITREQLEEQTGLTLKK